MSQLPQFRVYVNSSPGLRLAGCAGCLVALFIAGGFIGVLVFGWKTLLGM